MAFGSDADQYFSRASQAGSALGEATAPYFKEQMPLSPFEQQLAQVLSGRLEPEIAARQYQASKGGMGPGLGAPPPAAVMTADDVEVKAFPGPPTMNSAGQTVGQRYMGPQGWQQAGLDAPPPQASAFPGGTPGEVPWQTQGQAPRERVITSQPQTRRDLAMLMQVSPQLMQQRQQRDYIRELEMRNAALLEQERIRQGGHVAGAQVAAGARVEGAKIGADARVKGARIGAEQRGEKADKDRDAKAEQHAEMMKYRYAALRERAAHHDKLAKVAYARIKAGQGNNQKLRVALQKYGIDKAALTRHQIDMNKNPRVMDPESEDRKAFDAQQAQLMEQANASGEALAEALAEMGEDTSSIDITFGSSGTGASSGSAVQPPAGVPAQKPLSAKAAPKAAGGKIRVRRKSDGQTGSIPAGNFDPAKYEKI